MIDRKAIFEDLLHKNALRRQFGLPQWPVGENYAKQVDYASWCAFLREHGARIQADVLTEQRARYGPDWPRSGSGRMAYSCLVAKALAERFQA